MSWFDDAEEPARLTPEMLKRAHDKLKGQTKPAPFGEAGYEWVAPDPNAGPTPEERAEALAHFHDDPPPARCLMCFNLMAYCVCAGVPNRLEQETRVHPSLANVDKILPQTDRERMLAAYAERGVDDIQAFLNGDG